MNTCNRFPTTAEVEERNEQAEIAREHACHKQLFSGSQLNRDDFGWEAFLPFQSNFCLTLYVHLLETQKLVSFFKNKRKTLSSRKPRQATFSFTLLLCDHYQTWLFEVALLHEKACRAFCKSEPTMSCLPPRCERPSHV